MRRRLSLAMALIGDASVVLLDEPSMLKWMWGPIGVAWLCAHSHLFMCCVVGLIGAATGLGKATVLCPLHHACCVGVGQV